MQGCYQQHLLGVDQAKDRLGKTERVVELTQENQPGWASAGQGGATGYRIAVLGGTGKQGRGLALRWARAGYQVVIGSRQAEKAERVAAELNEALGGVRGKQGTAGTICGLSNAEAAQQADVAVLTVPYQAHQATLSGLREELQGKILVDVTVPLKPPQITQVFVPEDGPVAVQAQAILGEGVRVVAALQNVSEHNLRDPERTIDCDVLVCGDDPEAKARVIELVHALDPAVRALDAGPLANAVVVESLTPILIGLGKQYRRLRVGVRITGIGDER
jgi:NADPH-dependent F420 reductase